MPSAVLLAIRTESALIAHRALGLLDQALGHVAADVAGLTGGQIAVVALLEVDAQLGGDLILQTDLAGALS